MFSVKMKARLGALALAGAVFATLPAAASAGVVVRSSGPSAGDYPVGRQVADSATVTLRAGDRITILTDNGTRVIQGPGTFRVGEGATRTRTRFSRLSQRGAQRARTGAVRAGESSGPARAPNLWLVNVAAAGNVCLYDLERVRVWRPETSEAQTYHITDNSSGQILDIPFVEGETMRVIDPQVMSLANEGSYTFTAPAPEEGEATSVSVNFVTMNEQYGEADDLAVALIENGCTTQLGLLTDTLESAAN